MRHNYPLLLILIFTSLLLVVTPILLILVDFDLFQSLRLVLSQPGVLSSPTRYPWYSVAVADGVKYIVFRGPIMGALWDSLLLASVSALTISLLGLLASYAAMTNNSSWRVWLVCIVLSMPSFPFVDALVLRRLLDSDYGLTSLTKPLGFVLVPSGFAALYLYEVIAWLPLLAVMIGAYAAAIPREEFEAAIQLGAKGLSLLGLFVRLVRPALITVYVLGFVLVLDDIGGPYVFQDDPFARGLLAFRAYSYFIESVYGEISLMGIGFSVLLLALTLLTFLLGYKWYSSVSEALSIGKPGTRFNLATKWSIPIIVIIFTPSLIVKAASVAYAFTDKWVGPVFDVGLGSFEEFFSMPNMVRSTLNSSFYALLAASIMLVWSIPSAWYVARRQKASSIIDLLMSLPLGVPGIVLAYAYFFISTRHLPDFLNPLNSPSILLIVGYAARRLPIFYNGLKALVKSIPTQLDEAVYTIGGKIRHVIIRIISPLLLARTYALILYAFYSIATEVSLSITIGGLAGYEGWSHSAPLMYIVPAYIGFSSQRYGGVSAVAILFTYILCTIVATLFYWTISSIFRAKRQGQKLL